MLEGRVRITTLDTEGGSFIDDLEKGDLWYFPAGFPHTLQGLGPNGTEFLLIFDNGSCITGKLICSRADTDLCCFFQEVSAKSRHSY